MPLSDCMCLLLHTCSACVLARCQGTCPAHHHILDVLSIFYSFSIGRHCAWLCNRAWLCNAILKDSKGSNSKQKCGLVQSCSVPGMMTAAQMLFVVFVIAPTQTLAFCQVPTHAHVPGVTDVLAVRTTMEPVQGHSALAVGHHNSF